MQPLPEKRVVTPNNDFAAFFNSTLSDNAKSKKERREKSSPYFTPEALEKTNKVLASKPKKFKGSDKKLHEKVANAQAKVFPARTLDVKQHFAQYQEEQMFPITDKRLAKYNTCLLAADPGLGKTLMAIAVAVEVSPTTLHIRRILT